MAHVGDAYLVCPCNSHVKLARRKLQIMERQCGENFIDDDRASTICGHAEAATEIVLSASYHYRLLGNVDPDTGRLTGLSQAFGNANDLAVVIAISIPIGYFLLITSTSWIARILLIAVLALLLYGNILTVSRTGFLAIAVGLAVLLFHLWEALAHASLDCGVIYRVRPQ
jgi:hypothetical protein